MAEENQTFPTNEQIRKAVEKAIHEGLDDGGDWIAELEDGGEIEFRPAGIFQVGYCLEYDEDNPPENPPEQIEKTYTLRVRVEIVENSEEDEDSDDE